MASSMSPTSSSTGAVSPETPGESLKRLLPWLVAVAFFMESLDTTILNTAVPTIAKALAVAPLSMKAVLSSYTLSLAVFIPISGWMADRFGTRRVFASAIGLFTLGSFLCGISNNLHVLVACRILQGCGGAMMVPVGRLTLVRTFPKSELIRAMSFVAIPGLIGPMLGPTAGGFIVGYFHWRIIFFINLPIGLFGLYLVYRHLPDYREEHTHPLDTIGLILFGSGIALLSYVLEVFGEHTLAWHTILELLVLAIMLLAGYGLRATRTEFPLLRLSLFHIRTFRASVSGSYFTRLGTGGFPCLSRLLFQRVARVHADSFRPAPDHASIRRNPITAPVPSEQLPRETPVGGHIQVRICGGLRDTGGVSPAASPKITGTIAVVPSGIFNSAFHSGVLRVDTAKPMTQVPNPCAQAANSKFSAASQQSAATNGPCCLLQIMISVPAL